MNVKQLKQRLSEFDDDAVVVVNCCDELAVNEANEVKAAFKEDGEYGVFIQDEQTEKCPIKAVYIF